MPSLFIFTLENVVNKDLNLFDGDIKLTGEQRMAIALGMDIDNPFGRAAQRGGHWPGATMVYAIDPSLCKSKPAAIKNLNLKKEVNRFADRRVFFFFAVHIADRGLAENFGADNGFFMSESSDRGY